MRNLLWLPALPLLAACAVRPPSPPLPETLAPCDDCMPGIVNFARVSPALWRGAQPDAAGFRALADAGVTTVINLRMGPGNSDADLLAGTGIREVRIPMKAWRPERERLTRLLKEVEKVRREGGIAYLHCQQGRDRTGYSVAAYRMAVQGWTAEQAVDEMFAFRFNTVWRGNPDFLKSLDAAALGREISTP